MSPLGDLYVGEHPVDMTPEEARAALNPSPDTDTVRLADELEDLIARAHKEADDIRYYSGGSQTNWSMKLLAEVVCRNEKRILTALRQSSTPLVDGDAVLEEAARVAGEAVASAILSGQTVVGAISLGTARSIRNASKIVVEAIRALKSTSPDTGEGVEGA
jgi:hypothetical protein